MGTPKDNTIPNLIKIQSDRAKDMIVNKVLSILFIRIV